MSNAAAGACGASVNAVAARKATAVAAHLPPRTGFIGLTFNDPGTRRCGPYLPTSELDGNGIGIPGAATRRQGPRPVDEHPERNH